MEDKLINLLKRINNEFEKRGYFIEEDLKELVEGDKNVSNRLTNTKFKKIEFFDIEEEKSVGFTLEDVQVNFFIEYGEDKEGNWYEATAEIIYF